GGVVALLEGNLHGPVLRHGDPRVELIGAGEIAVHDDRLAPRDVPSQEFLGHLPAAALGSFRLAAAPGTWAHLASPERLSSTRLGRAPPTRLKGIPGRHTSGGRSKSVADKLCDRAVPAHRNPWSR